MYGYPKLHREDIETDAVKLKLSLLQISCSFVEPVVRGGKRQRRGGYGAASD
jgi:hypothetical protein